MVINGISSFGIFRGFFLGQVGFWVGLVGFKGILVVIGEELLNLNGGL
jgi:hypothetical protein